MGKRIAFVGAGALGGYVGGYLAHHGQDVTLSAAPIPAARPVAATANRTRTCEKIGP